MKNLKKLIKHHHQYIRLNNVNNKKNKKTIDNTLNFQIIKCSNVFFGLLNKILCFSKETTFGHKTRIKHMLEKSAKNDKGRFILECNPYQLNSVEHFSLFTDLLYVHLWRKIA